MKLQDAFNFTAHVFSRERILGDAETDGHDFESNDANVTIAILLGDF